MFIEYGTIKLHIHIHHGEHPYTCQQCDIMFTESGTIKVHIQIHHGNNIILANNVIKFSMNHELSTNHKHNTHERIYIFSHTKNKTKCINILLTVQYITFLNRVVGCQIAS